MAFSKVSVSLKHCTKLLQPSLARLAAGRSHGDLMDLQVTWNLT